MKAKAVTRTLASKTDCETVDLFAFLLYKPARRCTKYLCRNNPSDPSAPKTLSVGYYQTGVRTALVSNISMPAGSWRTLRIVTLQTGSINVYADRTLVYSTSNPLFVNATGAGLFNNVAGLALTNRWDNFTVFKRSVASSN
jgi:hypothetical protein